LRIVASGMRHRQQDRQLAAGWVNYGSGKRVVHACSILGQQQNASTHSSVEGGKRIWKNFILERIG
jgi:hypothetical protein